MVSDNQLRIDIFAYDFNEPDILARLVACGSRVRAIIDDSTSHGHPDSAETQAAARLSASAGADAAVRRMHFKSLQHNKVFVVRRGEQPVKVLFGSTNFSFRGLYVQANNALVFPLHGRSPVCSAGRSTSPSREPRPSPGDGLSGKWSLVQTNGMPVAHLCFSPHASSDLSLGPVGAAIDQASSSVFYAIAFLDQIRSGPVREAVDRLMGKDVFSYGIADKDGGLEIRKPDGSVGLVDFGYLAAHAPEPFKSEWSGGGGIHQHDKFVVTDFNLPTAKVFTGSSNLSPSGETGNGDNLVMIEDQRVATSYAIEALRIFDHLHFRSKMQGAAAPNSLTLARPPAHGQDPWFRRFYVDGSQAAKDRVLFSR